MEYDQEEELDIVEIAEELEMEGVAIEVENLVELGNMVVIDKIVDKFVENAYKAMHPDEPVDKIECHGCNEEIIAEFGRLIDEKENKIGEKVTTINQLGQRVKKLSADNLDLKKKLKETEVLRTIISTKNKEIESLKANQKVPTAPVDVEADMKNPAYGRH